MKKIAMMLVAVVLLSVISVGFADTFDSSDGLSQFDIEFVTISGDTNPTSGYGQVTGDYRMGKFEITNDQFAEFAANTPYANFSGGGVSANQVSWFEAAQFVNYLNTSTGNDVAYKFNGSTMSVWDVADTGYNATNPFRNINAKYFMPTEDEWVKAAYWNGTSLQAYATKAGENLTQGNGTSGTGWNYNDGGYATNPFGPWDVGSGSEELNGTYDMMGNVWEWMESPYNLWEWMGIPYSTGDYASGSYRSIGGGSYSYHGSFLSSSNRNYVDPYYEYDNVGFRVASVPEPCSLVLLGLGGLALRRRKN